MRATPACSTSSPRLKWVRDNIAEFGGDPGNVTIFGQSGGGGKVSTLMAMPAAQAACSTSAIVQSGSYYLKAMWAEEGTGLAVALLAALELEPADAASLASLPVDRLVDGLVKAMRGPAKANYRPVVDGQQPAGRPVVRRTRRPCRPTFR